MCEGKSARSSYCPSSSYYPNISESKNARARGIERVLGLEKFSPRTIARLISTRTFPNLLKSSARASLEPWIARSVCAPGASGG
jgi:hypothetical protein